ncbi:MAG: glucosaminidase domain-containing protein [Micromonosporaceae bacterium]
MPINLLALKHATRPAEAPDAALRSAVVNVAHYYLRIAEGKSPAEMEAIIWQHDSVDGADHGASCAAFASMTLELGAQAVGQQSWVTGGTSYPWPLHKWADVRVDPNPASLGIISIRQDAQAHHRWHPVGDAYKPLPGDWVLFDGHVEVITKYADGVLHTVGGDSLPNFSVNAHEYRDPLHAGGVVGFVNNGTLTHAENTTTPGREHASSGHRARERAGQGLAAIPGTSTVRVERPKLARAFHGADIPGDEAPARKKAAPHADAPARREGTPRTEAAPRREGTPRTGAPPRTKAPHRTKVAPRAEAPGAALIPGLHGTAHSQPARPAESPADLGGRRQPSPASTHDMAAQKAFISEVAPGAVAAQLKYGIPAAVTIAQAIEESGWGRSELATKDHNLFGIKGTGPAGSDPQRTREYENGRWATRITSFRVYHNLTECFDDHARLLASSGYYKPAMAVHRDPNAFAAALTGVYATDPGYGAKLIDLMHRHNLYQFDVVTPAIALDAAAPGGAARGGATIPGLRRTSASPRAGATSPRAGASSTRAGTAPASAAGAAQVPGTRSEAYRRLPRAKPSARTASTQQAATPVKRQARKTAPRNASVTTRRYQPHIPVSVKNAFVAMAKVPLTRAEPLYRDVAGRSGISWELLAACDWMQCEARLRYSPVHGEKLGTVNPDGTMYRTKSAALEQCADDLVELARTVYRIDLTTGDYLSIRDLANAFAAFRWGGLLKLHHTSAMEFPYSVEGLTAQHINMRWPNIADRNTPDRPGGRFHMPFGAVPIVLALNYPATV